MTLSYSKLNSFDFLFYIEDYDRSLEDFFDWRSWLYVQDSSLYDYCVALDIPSLKTRSVLMLRRSRKPYLLFLANMARFYWEEVLDRPPLRVTIQH